MSVVTSEMYDTGAVDRMLEPRLHVPSAAAMWYMSAQNGRAAMDAEMSDVPATMANGLPIRSTNLAIRGTPATCTSDMPMYVLPTEVALRARPETTIMEVVTTTQCSLAPCKLKRLNR